MQETLTQSIRLLKGIGDARAKKMSKLGIETINDAIQYFPREYEDRSYTKKIANLIDGESCTVLAQVLSDVTVSRPRRNLAIYKVVVGDDSFTMSITWFNQHYIKNAIKKGREYYFFGHIKRMGKRIEMTNAVYEKPGEDMEYTLRILPVYRLTGGLTQTHLRKAVADAIKMTEGRIKEIIPSEIRNRYHLSEINYCYQNIHYPKDFKDVEQARKRLVFEELLLLQLGLINIKGGSQEKKKGIRYNPIPEIEKLLSSLPFELTGAQKRVFNDIISDMTSEYQMNRLIQGDVGSGKTILAVLAMLLAVKNGFQVVFMVPTEILAEQHKNSIEPIMSQFGISVSLLTGRLSQKEKQNIKGKIQDGQIQVVIGTHAVLQEDVSFNSLGLVITDEQHRFGVKQRATLSSKSESPDVLVMTATPIPRTLALILYGDLDVSVIDELPPNRKPIKTYVVNESMRDRVNNFIRKEVKDGRQIYIVCPLVEESEAIEAENAIQMAERIKNNDFQGLSVGLIHGRMKAAEKESVMREFFEGTLDILVSTTVIEVGVNVPNATVMLIENAERFGLAQLHQLRGRVGRGEHQSYCVLFNQSDSEISKKRLAVMQETNDGFNISQKDLELRGPGDFFGTRQHGLPEFKIANLYNDMDILKMAQEVAFEIMDTKKLEVHPEYKQLKKELIKLFEERLDEITFA